MNVATKSRISKNFNGVLKIKYEINFIVI